MKLATPLVQKDPAGSLKVVVLHRSTAIARTSSEVEQTEHAINDYIQNLYSGPMLIEHLHQPGSAADGPCPALHAVAQHIDRGDVDLFIAADATRLDRDFRIQIQWVQQFLDRGTRVIRRCRTGRAAGPRYQPCSRLSPG